MRIIIYYISSYEDVIDYQVNTHYQQSLVVARLVWVRGQATH
jgi:hypothetical protein